MFICYGYFILAEPFKKNPEVGYLTLCPYTDNNLYRAVIKSISSTEAIVEYIDYGDSGTVPLNKLKNISQDLADLDYSTIQISLKGFVGATYTPKALQLLANYSAKKDKFSVVSITIYQLNFKHNTTNFVEFYRKRKRVRFNHIGEN